MKKLTPNSARFELLQMLKDSDKIMQQVSRRGDLEKLTTLLIYGKLAEESERRNKLVNPIEVKEVNSPMFDDYYLFNKLIVRISKANIAQFLDGKVNEIKNLVNG